MFSLRPLHRLLSVGLPAMAGTAGASAQLDRREPAGRIQPLVEVMTSVERRFIGKVVNSGLDQGQRRWLRHVEILPNSGLIYTLTLDAMGGGIRNSHGLGQECR